LLAFSSKEIRKWRWHRNAVGEEAEGGGGGGGGGGEQRRRSGRRGSWWLGAGCSLFAAGFFSEA
jgi:hypothetical protein